MRFKHIIVGVAMLCCSCSWFGQSNTSPMLEDTATASSEESPFSIEVQEALNDGQRLSLLATLHSSIDWAGEAAVVRLSGMRDGQTIREVVRPLAETMFSQEGGRREYPGGRVELRAGRKYQFFVSLPALEFTDYQLEFVWGEEAGILQAGTVHDITAQKSGAVRLTDLQVEREIMPCNESSCDSHFIIRANLNNRLPNTVTAVTLGVGFVWSDSNLDSIHPSPENEELIPMKGLRLATGQVQAVRLVFERAIPAPERGDEVRPVVRVIDWHSEGAPS